MNSTRPASHRLQIRTVVVQISRKLKATYRLRTGRLFSVLLATLVSTFTPLARALPDASTVKISAGQVNIDTSTANTMLVNQGTAKAVLDWRTFNIGTGELVRFAQPDAASVALNRVSGGASTIAGALQANGQVFLVNPAGVLFAPGAEVNVGGLVASTLNLSNTDFLAGRYQFSGGGLGTVTNQGSLAGRYVVLAGPTVNNSGTIDAARGSVGLLAGSRVTVDPAGAGLVNFSVDAGAVNAAITNSGAITADGGKVAVLASSLSDTLPTVINQSGVIRANTIANQNGTIVLSGGVQGVVSVSGTLEAKGANTGETGGTVKVLGDKVGLMAGAKVDASGDAGGGTVLVGGNWQGKGPEQNASATQMATGAQISADAVNSGNGGTVVVWADGSTAVGGAISARGGAQGGNGGRVETSGKEGLVIAKSTTVDTSAPQGTVGNWLLDPTNIIVATGGPAALGDVDEFTDFGTTQTIDPATINASATTVQLQATNDITVSNAIAMTTNGAGLDMQAGHNIAVNAGITLTGSMAINAGGAVTQTAAITSNGLLLAGAGTVALTNAGNSFTTIAATHGAGDINVVNNGSLTVGTVNGTNGISTGGNVTLTATGAAADLTVNQNITVTNAAAKTLTLRADRDVLVNATTGSVAIAAGGTGALNVDLNADRDASGGGAVVINASTGTASITT
ncbi:MULTISPECIES: filamentous hemagglutinin N-terminal domain-containing protein, partial [Ramlibacter]